MLSMFSMPYACSRLFGPWQQQDLVTGEERGSEVQCRICERQIVQWNVYFIAKRVSPPQALGQGEHSSEQWLGWDSNLTTWAKLLSTFVIWRSRAPYLAALSRKSCYRCHPLRGNLTLREHSFIIRNKERPDEIIFGINNSLTFAFSRTTFFRKIIFAGLENCIFNCDLESCQSGRTLGKKKPRLFPDCFCPDWQLSRSQLKNAIFQEGANCHSLTNCRCWRRNTPSFCHGPDRAAR